MNRTIPPLHPGLQALYDERIAAREWTRALVLVERQHRLEHLLHFIAVHGVETMLPAVGDVWQDSESVYEDEEEWSWVWLWVTRTRRGRPRKSSWRVMTKAERAVFEALPAEFVVYRGYRGEGGEHGLSWTIDRERAVWFARRFAGQDGEPMVATMTVNKSDIVAFFERENEIVIDGMKVCIERQAILEQLVSKRSSLDLTSSDES